MQKIPKEIMDDDLDLRRGGEVLKNAMYLSGFFL
jgi:hypothetical protein